MSDLIVFSFMTAFVYFMSLIAVEYANGKTKKVRHRLICLIILAFSIWNGWALYTVENIISVDAVEKKWKEYANYCKEQHISWSDLTFPEWLSIEASE